MTKKVLYIGVYRDKGGWAQTTKDNILAMDSVGIEVVPRPIIFSPSSEKLHPRIEELERRSPRGATVVIQHILPNMMEYNGKFEKNIGVYCTETTNFRASNWPEKLNCMDENWVCSNQMEEAARASFVTTPIKVLPYATSLAKFQRSYKPFSALKPQADSFLFYTISSGNKRKNLSALIRAFHMTFEHYEPVELVIKCEQNKRDVEDFCNKIKAGLKIRGGEYKQEIVLSDFFSEEGIYRLHNSCDCFVSTSFGEAWCVPAFDAMGFGKTPIVPNWGGYLEYMTSEAGWLLPVREEPCYGVVDSFDDLYTSNECWGAVSIPDLCLALRQAYENKAERENKASAGMDRVYDFDYEIVGAKINDCLESSGKKT